MTSVDNSLARYEGGCQCGLVRYWFEGDCPPAYACHCSACKKQSASAFSMSLVIARSRLHVLHETRWFEVPSFSGAAKTCHFCPHCGTRLWHSSSHAVDLVTLKVGTLDNSASIVPRAHLWVSNLQAGIRLDPNVPTFDTQPDNFADWRRQLT
jgi:hypothetical protein